jgi:acyl-CoA dehydrogenase
MSEPDSGSDLASIRTKASKTDGGWLVNGTKLWTTGAHHCHTMITLVRTSPPDEKNRHAGMSQLLINMKAPGVTIRPIRDLAGNEHFNEVVFQDAFVPETMLIGKEGAGWGQVMAELANERSGPERYLSCYPLLQELIGALPKPWGQRERIAIGRQVAHLMTLRRMSIGVAGMLEAGENPTVEASLVKDQGGVFEQALPNLAQDLIPIQPRSGEDATDFQQVLAHLMQNAPAFSLRGGTREILRGIIARGLGLR